MLKTAISFPTMFGKIFFYKNEIWLGTMEGLSILSQPDQTITNYIYAANNPDGSAIILSAIFSAMIREEYGWPLMLAELTIIISRTIFSLILK